MLKLYRNIDIALTLKKANKKSGRHIQEQDLSPLKNAAMIVSKNKIVWIGKEKTLSPQLFKKLDLPIKKIKEIDLGGHQIMPSFIESHTHSVFAGDRQNEFELRNQGVTYQQIAQQGGGIKSTVKQTRKASSSKLSESLQKRVQFFLDQGVSLLEIKSGYGLNLKTEMKMLEVIKSNKSINTVATFLGPHACPNDYKNYDDYMESVLNHMLPKLIQKGLIDRADVFLEKGYFSAEQVCKYFEYLSNEQIPLTSHVDQLTNSRAIKKLCHFNRLQSLDHLVCIDSSGIKTLAACDTTAVLLPVADFYLKMKYPPARKMLDAGVRVALATDFNPGSSPSQDLSFVGVLARLNMQMTLPEVLVAYTLNAAHAIGFGDRLGSLTEGKDAHFVVLDDDYDKLFYSVGYHPVKKVYFGRL